jgi:hypothetical protein
MAGTTPKGVPYATGGDAASDIDARMQALAEWVDARPGTANLTTIQRDALAAPDLWEGKRIWNLTDKRFEYRTAAGLWVPEPGQIHLPDNWQSDAMMPNTWPEGDSVMYANTAGGAGWPFITEAGTSGRGIVFTRMRKRTTNGDFYAEQRAVEYETVVGEQSSGKRMGEWVRNGYVNAAVSIFEWGPWRPLSRSLVARVYRTAAGPSIANSTVTAYPFDTEYWDPDGLHDNVTNNHLLTIPATWPTMRYDIWAQAVWTQNVTGQRQVEVTAIGGSWGAGVSLAVSSLGAAGTTNVLFQHVFVPGVLLAAGEQIRAALMQTSGAGLVAISGAWNTSLSISREGG